MNTNNPIVHRDKLLVRNKVSIQCLLRMADFLDLKVTIFSLMLFLTKLFFVCIPLGEPLNKFFS